MTKKIRKIFCITPLVCCFSLTSCSTVKYEDKPELYGVNYNVSSPESVEMSKVTLSLNFEFSFYESSVTTKKSYSAISGTGWIYEKSEKNSDYYYIATNLHVANVLTFGGHTIEYYGENEKFTSRNYIEVFSSQVKFVSPSTITDSFANSNSYIPNQNLNSVYVNNPEIVYTTTTDSEYNSIFSEKLYSKFGQELQGITDIAILCYYFPHDRNYYFNNLAKRNTYLNMTNSFNEHDYSSFVSWLDQERNISVYTKNIDEIKNAYNRNYYMAGFPQHSKEEINKSAISWWSFSNFEMNSLMTNKFQYSWNNYVNKNEYYANPIPIPFYGPNSNSNFSSYNYISAGREGFFYACSYQGASGSPILTYIDGKLQIVGIYWGTSTFDINGEIRELGACDFFVSSNGSKKFNLTNNIKSAITINENKLTQNNA